MIEKFKEAGIEISVEQEKQLSTLMEFMLEYNKNVNLTRITEYDEVVEKHYIDSILPLTMVDVPHGTFCADIGTGAGFPSLPMNIYRPDLKFTLIDSLGKRITYLDLACEKIGLKCKTIHARSEEAAKKPELREKFGFVTARAVAALNVLCEYCMPYVKVGGVFAALKGAEDECAVAEMATEDTELISIYYGEDMTEEDAEALSERLSEIYTDCDIEVNAGGQPVYYCIIAVE